LQRPGRAGRETGGRWRVHSVFDLARERFTTFELTDESEGEVIDRIAEIRVGDRAYLQRDRIAEVLDVVVPAGWNNARWLDSKANRLAFIPLLKKAR